MAEKIKTKAEKPDEDAREAKAGEKKETLKAEAPQEPKAGEKKETPKPEAPKEAPKKETPKPEAPKEEPRKEALRKKPEGAILLFNRWDVSGVVVEDKGLVRYINMKPMLVPRTAGKYGKDSVHKHMMPLAERLMNKLMVPGHRGKKHKITSKRCCGNTQTIYSSMVGALEILEKRAKQNPVQIMVKAVENSAPLEEVAAYRLGGMVARKAVNVSPQRRLDLALRHLSQGIYKSTFRTKKTLAQAIADGLMAAHDSDPKCFAVSEKIRMEKEADGAR